MAYTFAQRLARADEETGTNGAADGNHVQMAAPHGLIERDELSTHLTLAEGREVEAVPGPESFLLAGSADGSDLLLAARARHAALAIGVLRLYDAFLSLSLHFG